MAEFTVCSHCRVSALGIFFLFPFCLWSLLSCHWAWCYHNLPSISGHRPISFSDGDWHVRIHRAWSLWGRHPLRAVRGHRPWWELWGWPLHRLHQRHWQPGALGGSCKYWHWLGWWIAYLLPVSLLIDWAGELLTCFLWVSWLTGLVNCLLVCILWVSWLTGLVNCLLACLHPVSLLIDWAGELLACLH